MKRPCPLPQSPEVRDLTLQQAVVARLLVQEVLHRAPDITTIHGDVHVLGDRADLQKPLTKGFRTVDGSPFQQGCKSALHYLERCAKDWGRALHAAEPDTPLSDLRQLVFDAFHTPVAEVAQMCAPLTFGALSAVGMQEEGAQERMQENPDLWGRKSRLGWLKHCLPFMHDAYMGGPPPEGCVVSASAEGGDHFVGFMAKVGEYPDAADTIRGRATPGSHHFLPVFDVEGVHAVIMPNGQAYGLIVEEATDTGKKGGRSAGHERNVGLKKPDGSIVTFTFVRKEEWVRRGVQTHVWATISSERTNAHRSMVNAFTSYSPVLARKMKEQEQEQQSSKGDTPSEARHTA